MVMVASIGKESGIFAPKATVKARVGNVSNLKPGSYVELKGIRVGTVQSIDIINEEDVEILFTVLEKEMKWIRKDTTVAISNAGLVGDKFLEIKGGSKEAGNFDPEKDILLSENAQGFDEMIKKGQNIAEVTNNMMVKLDAILTSMDNGKIIISTAESISKASANLEVITRELKDARIGTMVTSVNRSMGSMERIMSRIEKGPGTMNSMIYDDSLHEELRGLLGGAQRNKVIKYFIRESIKNSEKRDK